jgi:hypothetical protein
MHQCDKFISHNLGGQQEVHAVVPVQAWRPGQATPAPNPELQEWEAVNWEQWRPGQATTHPWSCRTGKL